MHLHASWHISSCRSCLNPGSSLYWPQNFWGQLVLTVMFSPISASHRIFCCCLLNTEGHRNAEWGHPKLLSWDASQNHFWSAISCPCPRMSPRLLWSRTFQHTPNRLQEHRSEARGSPQAPLRPLQWLMMLNFLSNSPYTREFKSLWRNKSGLANRPPNLSLKFQSQLWNPKRKILTCASLDTPTSPILPKNVLVSKIQRRLEVTKHT